MANKHSYLEDAILNVLKGTTLTGIATCKIGLLTTICTDTTAGVEASSGNYARQSITWGAIGAGPPRNIANTNLIQFPAMSGWLSGVIVGWAVYDNNSANILFWGTASKTINTGDIAQFAIGTIVYSED